MRGASPVPGTQQILASLPATIIAATVFVICVPTYQPTTVLSTLLKILIVTTIGGSSYKCYHYTEAGGGQVTSPESHRWQRQDSNPRLTASSIHLGFFTTTSDSACGDFMCNASGTFTPYSYVSILSSIRKI